MRSWFQWMIQAMINNKEHIDIVPAATSVLGVGNLLRTYFILSYLFITFRCACFIDFVLICR
uniref:Uncharacterized protein n=1 Tax=Parascaris univalens TaxID=6257 RepID=A0A915AWT9_PARUN